MKSTLTILLFASLYSSLKCNNVNPLIKLDLTSNSLNTKLFGNETYAPYGAMSGIASINVPAYSNGNDTYISNQSNYFYGVYTGMKWQCVEYARRWLFVRKGCTFDSVVAATDIWTQISIVQQVVGGKCFTLKKQSDGSKTRPTNESLLIYKLGTDMPYGHVSVIVDVLPNSIRVAEQNYDANYWLGNYSREIPYVLLNGSYYINDSYPIYGWISVEDNNQTYPLNQSTIDKITRQNISFPDFVCSKGVLHYCFSVYCYLLFICFTFGLSSMILRPNHA
ncbi:unnamed protein product [Rotaria socialis]|uniref:Peptidase C51 domain-containing protein n=3 Tax=Rotaria socialis TaxID=392032 RepID=A0A817V6B1_9BILA|nr:unnamed protein product [Rotaria socialis]CAF3413579.1 unnamed protein product [Rotaria socialis]CAF4111702.1 unnamed protein product [Rotaria socialis]CAF4346119.1 unnamed protein product [Rotaria socialis]